VVHRELKQLTGIESCHCRKGRIQRNHIHCALLVWDFLRRQARGRSVSLYQAIKWLINPSPIFCDNNSQDLLLPFLLRKS
jgi:hypothetical protein